MSSPKTTKNYPSNPEYFFIKFMGPGHLVDQTDIFMEFIQPIAGVKKGVLGGTRAPSPLGTPSGSIFENPFLPPFFWQEVINR